MYEEGSKIVNTISSETFTSITDTEVAHEKQIAKLGDTRQQHRDTNTMPKKTKEEVQNLFFANRGSARPFVCDDYVRILQREARERLQQPHFDAVESYESLPSNV
jgi:thiamine monophosphate synthase